MSMRIVPIVEGHGDAKAIPILLRRLAGAHSGEVFLAVSHPIRVPRTRLLKERELERAVELAGRQTSAGDGILVLVDADDDCPAELGPKLLARAREARGDRRIRVVLAKKEFEAWFLAAAESIRGRRGLRDDLLAHPDPESVGSAKSWLSRNCDVGQRYKATIDQAPLTEVFDIEAARSAPSFDKLWRDIMSLFTIGGE